MPRTKAERINLMVVDLYHGDVVTSFADAATSGIRGIIHKATQGTRVADSAYGARRGNAADVGLLWGAYHFATDEDVGAQVGHFLGVARPDPATLLALDFEPHSNHTMRLSQARRFLVMVEQKLGRKAVLYSGNLIKEQLDGKVDAFFGSHRLWLAQYGPIPKVQRSWKKPWLWQYSADGIGPGPHKVPGIPGANGQLDLNSYNGTPEQLATEWAS
jgi:GH25 family lysozyme M1 (1,4-beta-N-acetylmuramidase)